MDERVMQLIFEAALRASREMGNDLKQMSCFVSNWAEQADVAEDNTLEAA